MKNFLELSANELLNEFGGGKHAPGSGSAAALIGLLAANLVYTVGQLTISKPKYVEFHSEMAASCNKIQTILIPNLQQLFQRDAEAFDAVYRARIARDNAVDEGEKARLQVLSLHEQKLATAIPFEIAEACLALIDISGRIFDVGFRAARGDSGVALSAAVAGILSAVFVINLNLIPFRKNYWASQRRKECDQLQQTAIDKYQATLARANALRAEDVDMLDEDGQTQAIADLISRAKDKYDDAEIDKRAAELRTLVWHNRHNLWPVNQVPSDPVEMLSPDVALRFLGYELLMEESLGTFTSSTGTFEVAGLLEALRGTVRVSRKMRPDVRLFTSAHELGHILLHPKLRQAHRDRPLDGAAVSREQKERDADRFASSYLMPSKLINDRFSKIFKANQFVLTDLTVFALWGAAGETARHKVKNLRELSFILATTERYNGKQVVSLSAQFKVSPTAMAIRLEELELLRFN